jgi:hypothetical protein
MQSHAISGRCADAFAFTIQTPLQHNVGCSTATRYSLNALTVVAQTQLDDEAAALQSGKSPRAHVAMPPWFDAWSAAAGRAPASIFIIAPPSSHAIAST